MALPETDINSCTDNVEKATEIFAEYGDFIYAVIRYKVRDESRADDLFQDFFLSLVSKPLAPEVKDVKSYLYRAITNDIIDAVRRVENYKDHLHKYAKNIDNPINKKTSGNAYIDKGEVDKIFELIEERLQHSESQAITLRYRDDYDIREVAERMDVNSKSVSRYISVGLKKVRQLLKTK